MKARDAITVPRNEPLMQVTLMGEEKTCPAIPNANIRGSLYAEPGGLVFREAGHGSGSLGIPWDNIRRCDWDIGEPTGPESVFWFYMTPISILSLGLLTGYFAYVWVVYWDERYGTEFEVWFKVGPQYERDRAAALVGAIWAARGYDRSTAKQSFGHILRRS